MSPQRKKGRGGGGGKTFAPPPSRLQQRLSPPLLPCKIIQERRALRHSHHASASLPSADPPLDALLPPPSHSFNAAACRKSSPKSLRPVDSEKRARNASTKASAVGLNRARRSAKEEQDHNGGKDSKANALVTADRLCKEAKGSGRRFQRETGSDNLRWSTTALLSQNSKCRTACKLGVKGGDCDEIGFLDATCQDASEAPDFSRFVRGPTISATTFAEEPCEAEGVDILSASSKSIVQQNCPDVAPQLGYQQERNFSIQSNDNVSIVSNSNNSDSLEAQAAAIPGAQNGISNFSSALHRRLAILEGKVSQIAVELRKTKEMLDSNYPRGSVVLTDIQGKISSIERAMASRLSDLEAVHTRPEDDVRECPAPSHPLPTERVSSKNEASSISISATEDPLAILDATSSDLRRASDHETTSKQLAKNIAASDLRTPVGLTCDQQELEDRLFPHRKLLKSRQSLHDKVVDSRAVLHSKLGDVLCQAGGESQDTHLHGSRGEWNIPMEFASYKQLPCKRRDETLEMRRLVAGTSTCGTMPAPADSAGMQHCGSCSLEKETTGELGALGTGIPTSSMGPLQEPFQSTNSGREGQDPQLSNADLLNCNSVTEGDRSEQGAYRSKETCVQGSGSTENAHLYLECEESLPLNDAFENQENVLGSDAAEEEYDDFPVNQLYTIGERIATAGWYVSEGDAIVLAQDNGCCSYYDVANMEEKAQYKAPEGIPNSLWNDCWLIRAAGSDGRSNKYIVAASAGSTLDCGFCAWDFYSKDLVAYHSEYQTMSPGSNSSAQSSLIHAPSFRNPLSSSFPLACLPLADTKGFRPVGGSKTAVAEVGISSTLCHFDNSTLLYQTELHDSAQWWYRPCGPLMASAASSLRSGILHDIRDGDIVMTWTTRQPILNLEYGSPVQWRNKDKLAIAEEDAISIWDVNSMDSQCLQYIKLSEKRASAFQMLNADSECSGGVRQRLSSSKAEGYDGICCTEDDISVIDLRVPEGLGNRLPVSGLCLQSVFAQGDMILTGGLNKASGECGLQQWSLRKAMPVCTFMFPASNCHYTHLSLTQVWGHLDMVMAVNGNGLYIFKGGKEATEDGTCVIEEVNDVIGSQDLFNPTFDYANSRVLLISRDQPASWCYWP